LFFESSRESQSGHQRSNRILLPPTSTPPSTHPQPIPNPHLNLSQRCPHPQRLAIRPWLRLLACRITLRTRRRCRRHRKWLSKRSMFLRTTARVRVWFDHKSCGSSHAASSAFGCGERSGSFLRHFGTVIFAVSPGLVRCSAPPPRPGKKGNRMGEEIPEVLCPEAHPATCVHRAYEQEERHTDGGQDDAEPPETSFGVHVGHAKDRRHECQRKEKHVN